MPEDRMPPPYRKARTIVRAVYVARAAVSEAGGSVEEAIALVRALRAKAAEAGDQGQYILAGRTIAVLQFALRPFDQRQYESTALILENHANARRQGEQKPPHKA